jgi:hypothetical protein
MNETAWCYMPESCYLEKNLGVTSDHTVVDILPS